MEVQDRYIENPDKDREERKFRTWLNERKILYDRLNSYLIALSFLILAYVSAVHFAPQLHYVIAAFGIALGISFIRDMFPSSRRITQLTKEFHEEAGIRQRDTQEQETWWSTAISTLLMRTGLAPALTAIGIFIVVLWVLLLIYS